ncbi:hypothetical protein OM076_24485 [Solirubrobacter ginsenosidimutans]|uniref:Uncharacterized protein n=1 Tax=Solirubrobacter ginsenosidimutans TaxID=490573 RepID=A0A9X3S2E5_9ACTN|nr:hypothetical protein [Solirubrobacter ginsenosidimutans]MDA0163454.1 hypothetical protein [Solirubrobacter ginsenosidimutans]
MLILLSFLLAVPAAAEASSVAYIENGEVWVSSLDGAAKARLAAPVVNSAGETEKWLAVAASDRGRIVAVRNFPGRNAGFSWFKVWEPDGTSTVEGPLNYPGGWAVVVYPLGFDVTPDGAHMVYGYSNSGFCCPISYGRGTYVRPVSSSPLPPISISGQEEPSLFGTRVIARSDSTTITVQDPATTYGDDFEPWLDVSATGLEVRRTDIAASGNVAALEGERWQGGTQTVGKIAVLSINGFDQGPTGAVDCFLPSTGLAKDVSLSQDGRSVAWTDGGGLKVAGTPTSANDPCDLTSPPVVIAAGGTSASIGGGDVTPFLPPAPAPPVTAPASAPAQGGMAPPMTISQPALALPAKVTAKALKAGLPLKVTVGAAGKVTVVMTVGGKKVGGGSATATRAGQVTVKVKLTKAGRKLARKGKKLTIKVTQAGRTVTKTVKLR